MIKIKRRYLHVGTVDRQNKQIQIWTRRIYYNIIRMIIDCEKALSEWNE